MNILLAIALILSFVALYMFVIEAFFVAFKLTGLATKKIKFQVASLFTSTGFTTSESEIICRDERRRKIAITCMYTSHIFSVVIMGLLINLVISVFISISDQHAVTVETFTSWYSILFYISIVLFLIMLLLKIPPINRKFQAFLEKLAISMSINNRNKNILTVIDIYGKNAVAEVCLNRVPEYAKNLSLFELELNKKYNINVLSILRGNRTIEVTRDTMFAQGDIVIVFGSTSDIKEAFINNVESINNEIPENESNILTLLDNFGTNALMEIEIVEVPTEIEGLSMKDSHLPDKYSINVGMIKRDNNYIVPDKDTIIQKGDKIIVFGPHKTIQHLFQ